MAKLLDFTSVLGKNAGEENVLVRAMFQIFNGMGKTIAYKDSGAGWLLLSCCEALQRDEKVRTVNKRLKSKCES